MLNPIKTFNNVSSTIQNVTGYSFSLSNIPKNLNKITFPAVVLATGMYVAASAKDPFKICSVHNYDGCIASCGEICLKYQESFFHELGKCVRACVSHFPSD
jgi:hypothetical protein